MRLSTIGCLLAFATRATLSAVAPRAVCNADNVLRALRANSAQASPFCSTYTLPPPNQPLPTYVSQYPASRVSSACTCLITQSTTSTSISSTTSSTSSTTPPTPVSTCKTERITNGNFEQKLNNQPVAWQFAGEVHDPSGNGAYTLSTFNDENGNTYGSFFIQNSATGATGTTTIKQSTPALCGGTTYKLTYSSQISITNGSPGRACSVRISLADQQLVYIGPPNGDPPPFTYQVRETTFVYTGTRAGGNVFTVEFSCNAPQGFYKIDDISLVGV
ncbi:MAG: hypothetical protein HETSPECPRED_002133 [Heterodermia speciosa]|uniref:Ubiquitin 3 binding protein But2 C-terminal domain-containing protein n=1 Tax=Heterodermia speciosa TaxID=116794 RepID=A0A8H3PGB6_9LECA|nr:MAG: hypothetical protein HETSPECPRED_002133 [Heterodermia speciosa]